jgi:hypothetical protein
MANRDVSGILLSERGVQERRRTMTIRLARREQHHFSGKPATALFLFPIPLLKENSKKITSN